MIRAFLALPLPDAVRDALAAAQAGLPVGRPVPPENLHLTLVFLGEQPEPVLEDLHVALETVRAPALSLRLSGVGVFGNVVPRVLYAGVAAGPELAALRKKLARLARESGIALGGERYRPHVTLVRFPREMSGEELAALHGFLGRRMALDTGSFAVGEFSLYRSTLGRSGPVYEAIADYPLG